MVRKCQIGALPLPRFGCLRKALFKIVLLRESEGRGRRREGQGERNLNLLLQGVILILLMLCNIEYLKKNNQNLIISWYPVPTAL